MVGFCPVHHLTANGPGAGFRGTCQSDAERESLLCLFVAATVTGSRMDGVDKRAKKTREQERESCCSAKVIDF